MLDLINSLKYVGPPPGNFHKHTTTKIPNVYFVTWYLKDGKVRYNVLGPPALIASTALLAEKANLGLTTNNVSEIMLELSFANSLRHHVEFSSKALASCFARHL